MPAIFDDAKSLFKDTNFHGCLDVNVMGEFSGKYQSIEDLSVHFKQWEISVLHKLCLNITTIKPDELAHKLFVLLEDMSLILEKSVGHGFIVQAIGFTVLW